jgi:PIN domain nuclease of toxin-antitoxin system
MIVGIADTHTIVWYLMDNTRLSASANQFLETSAQDGNQIGISSITLVEIIYLIEKGRIAAESLTSLATRFSEQSAMFVEIPLDLQITRTLSRISPVQIPDMPDRIIAATALHLNVPLVSRDGKIRLSAVQTIW